MTNPEFVSEAEQAAYIKGFHDGRESAAPTAPAASVPAALTDGERAVIAAEIAELDAVIGLDCDEENEMRLCAALARALTIADFHRDHVAKPHETHCEIRNDGVD